MAGINKQGIRAYQAGLEASEKAALHEPDQLLDELIEKSEAQGIAMPAKDSLKHMVGTDLRHQMPPQMYAIVASLAKLIEVVDSDQPLVTLEQLSEEKNNV